MKKVLLLAFVGCLAASGARAQHRATDLAQAWMPEFRIEANFIGSYIDNPDFVGDLGNRFTVSEAGVGLRSYVDPFFRFDFVFSGGDGAGPDGMTSEFGIEQAKVTWLAAPWGAEVRMGKMQTSVGEYNDDDPDEHPEVTAPDIILSYFGADDGYIDTGVSANIYVPNPWDLSNIFWLGVFNGDNAVAFHGGRERHPVYFTRYESFWELGDLTGMELTFAYVTGVNSRSTLIDNQPSDVRGVTRIFNLHWDLDYTDPHAYLYSGWKILAEFFHEVRDYDKRDHLTAVGRTTGLNTDSHESTQGFYALGEYKLGRNWGIGGRLDSAPVLLASLGEATEGTAVGNVGGQQAGSYTIYGKENQTAYSFITSYYPSRFSTVRFQYTNRRVGEETVNEYWLQLQVLIGFERPDVF